MQRLFFLLSIICLLAGPALAQTSSLLITEYLEGSGNNKALEIYNGTEDVISLGSYSIERYSNGSTTSVSIPLDAVDLDPGEAWVIVNPQSESALLALANQIDSELNFNGNDALVLLYAGSQVVDSFGRVGEDPGDYWSDPCLEYSFFPSDVITGLGVHFADCGAVGSDHTTWGTLKANFR